MSAGPQQALAVCVYYFEKSLIKVILVFLQVVSLHCASIAAVLFCLTENTILYHPIGQIKVWKTELWEIPHR